MVNTYFFKDFWSFESFIFLGLVVLLFLRFAVVLVLVFGHGFGIGVLECWSVGVLECWSAGVLQSAVLQSWSVGEGMEKAVQYIHMFFSLGGVVGG